MEFIGLLQNGARFIQTYQLSETDYNVDYTLKTEGFQSSDDIVLHWENYLDRLEKIHPMKSLQVQFTLRKRRISGLLLL